MRAVARPMAIPPLALVTGGAGFIGSHLVERLLAEGYRVRVLDNFSTGSRKTPAFAGRGARLEIQRGELASLKHVQKAARGASVIFHQAALRSVPRSVEDPLGANSSNVTGTLHLLVAGRRKKAKPRLVYASSSSVAGERAELPKREDQPTAPISPYAATKVAGELYASVGGRLLGVEAVGPRYFNVFGPRQDPKSEYAAVIPKFILWGMGGKPLHIHGDGTQSRDFTYIDNGVSANLLAARAPAPAVSGKSKKVGWGSGTSLLEIVAMRETMRGRSRARTHEPGRVGDVPHTLADVSAAKRDMGYEPLVGFEEGLRRTVAFFT